jgi:hypothetical protein
MRHVRSLGFEAMEARKLLTAAHHAVTHAAQVAASVPLELDGTLTVDTKAASTTMNTDESMTTSTPVAGVFSGLGQVRGVWNTSVDSQGNYDGPDTLRLHDPKGAFVVIFNDGNPGRAHRIPHGAEYNPLFQKIYGGTGAYARASESGTIQLSTNAALKAIESMTLTTGTGKI